MAGSNKPMIKNKISAPIPAPGRTLCDKGTGVGVAVDVAVGVTEGVAVSGINVAVGVADEVGAFVGVSVAVAVGVNVKVGGMGVAVRRRLTGPSCSSSSPAGGQGVTPPAALGVPQACADTERLGAKSKPQLTEAKTNHPSSMQRFTIRSLVGVNFPAQFFQLAHIEFIRRHIDVHARSFGIEFLGFGIVNSAPSFGNATFIFQNLADDFQALSDGHIFPVFNFQLSGKHEARILRVIAHVCAPRNLVNDRRDDAAMQHTGEAFKMFRRGVLAFDHAGFGLVKMQMQSDGIFHPADEAIS